VDRGKKMPGGGEFTPTGDVMKQGVGTSPAERQKKRKHTISEAVAKRKVESLHNRAMTTATESEKYHAEN